MTVPKQNPDAEEQRRNAIHSVSGRVIDCCETGETDCPCICHDDADGGGQQ